MIPPKTVQAIIDATRIEEVVEEFITLKKRGVNWVGLCPFHHEKTPSLNVNPTLNIFKCFGCGKGGDAITFLREHDKLTFHEALHWLARKYNITIEEEQRTPEQLAAQLLEESLYIVTDFAQKTYENLLFDSDEGKSVALSYLKNRGLSEDTIRKFGLGYAPDTKDELLKKALAIGHSSDLMKKVGLLNAAGNRDFFRARVMFPIFNLSGKIVAFAGRTMTADKSIPKYINSPETEIYVKNKILYGLYQAKTAIRKCDECLLTEGYMDVISMMQAGIENVVASSGTALTEGQLLLIRRNTSNIKFLYDSDTAGVKAALRGLDLALEQDLNVKLVLLPAGEDPDSFIQKFGAGAFKQYISEEAKDFILFKTGLLLSETQGDPIKKAHIVKDIVASIAKVPDPIKRHAYVKECAAIVGIAEDTLLNEVKKAITREIKKQRELKAHQPEAASDAPTPEGDTGFPTHESSTLVINQDAPTTYEQTIPVGSDEAQERDIIRILVHHARKFLETEGMSVAEYILSEFQDLEDLNKTFENPLYGKLVQECLAIMEQGGSLDTDFFVQHANPEVRKLATDLLTEPWEMSPLWEERYHYPLQNQPVPELNYIVDARQSLHRFILKKLKKNCDNLMASIKASAESGNIEEMSRLMMFKKKIDERRNAIAQKFGIVVL